LIGKPRTAEGGGKERKRHFARKGSTHMGGITYGKCIKRGLADTKRFRKADRIKREKSATEGGRGKMQSLFLEEKRVIQDFFGAKHEESKSGGHGGVLQRKGGPHGPKKKSRPLMISKNLFNNPFPERERWQDVQLSPSGG